MIIIYLIFNKWNGYIQTKKVNILIEFDIDNIYKFSVDNKIVVKDEYAGTIWIIGSTITHPLIHAFVNRNQIKNGNILFNIFSQFVNHAALKLDMFFNCSKKMWCETLENNASNIRILHP
eukprot:249971_1